MNNTNAKSDFILQHTENARKKYGSRYNQLAISINSTPLSNRIS